MAIIASTVATIKSDPLHSLGGAQAVNDFFKKAGHVWRERALNPANTISLFILQMLHGNTAISNLRHLSHFDVSDSSYCAARARLPVAAFGGLVGELCRESGKCMEDAALWLGRRVRVADGTGTLAPDMPALQKQWPQR